LLPHLGVTVQQLVHAEIFVVIAEGVVECLSNTEPAEEEEKLQAEKKWDFWFSIRKIPLDQR
jgi:hypothetical protein